MKRSKNSHPTYEPKISTARYVFRKNGYNDGDLTFDQWYELSQQNCYYCGRCPSTKANRFIDCPSHRDAASEYAKKYGTFIYNGVDRINNMEHHIDECVPCCQTCNMAKGTMPIKAFKAWIIKVYEHFASKK